MKDSKKHDADVKIRLIEAGGEIFAEYGYKSATIRMICDKAGAHVGAVNYHFRDKQGLFSAVLEHAHQWSVNMYPPDLGLQEGASPQDRLAAFIRSFLLRVLGDGVPDWHGRLIARGVMEHSEALEPMVTNSIQPLYDYLKEIIDQLLEGDAADQGCREQTFLCAMSVLGQCLNHFTGQNIVSRIKPEQFNQLDIERITEHITRFSLGGIQELKRRRNGHIP